jgi:predicted SpoU family rRNA methylase
VLSSASEEAPIRNTTRESESEVRNWAEPAVRAYADLLASNLATVAEKLESETDRKKIEVAIKKVRETTYEEMNGSMAIFDTPQACLERLTALRESLNPGRVICWFNLMGVIPHERVMRSMELFASKVLPYV